MEETLWNATPKIYVKENHGTRNERWFDKECLEKRKRVKFALNRARTDSSQWEMYREEKREYKKLIKAKKNQIKLKYLERLRGVQNINQAWEFIQKGRKPKRVSNVKPSKEQVIEHFKKILNGQEENNQIDIATTTHQASNNNFDELTVEELRNCIAKLKKKKATGTDNIMGEAFIYANEETLERMQRLFEETWKENRYRKDGGTAYCGRFTRKDHEMSQTTSEEYR